MNQTEFLEAVLPKNGCWYIVGIKPTWEKGEWHPGVPKANANHRRVETIAAAVKAAESFAEDGDDVYYRTASFGQGDNKSGSNVTAKNELYIDLEAAKGKDYTTQEEARAALKKFLSDTGLPHPTVVCSGRGFHLHWIFTAPVDAATWKVTAEALKRACFKNNFKVDSACTADLVRLLRVPETTNHKDNSPVGVVRVCPPTEFATLKKILEPYEGAVANSAEPFTLPGVNPNKGVVNALTKALADNQESSFEIILKKCAVARHCVANRTELLEPQWRWGLSLGKFCTDKAWALAEVSIDHPGYSEEATDKKASSIPGPHSCEEASQLFPGGCNECPHRGKIKSPIVLGREVIASDVPPDTPTPTTSNEEYPIPELPQPYFRGKNGGIYKHIAGGEDGPDSELIYPHDFYIVKRMTDPQIGDVLMFRLHLPKDGTREFTVSQSDITSKEKCREALTREGIAIFTPKQIDAMQNYIVKTIIEMQYRDSAEKMHARFGWSTGDSFVLGNTEYTPKGPKHCPAPHNLKHIAQYLEAKGTLEGWSTIANFYDRPTMEPHAFTLFCAFGAPLIHMSRVQGGYVNLYSNSSGTGKTTATMVMNSVYGNPVKLLLNSDDTQNAIIHRIGTMSSIAVSVDEVTNASPERMSAFLYQSSNGRAKNRMESKGNEERQNNTDFTTIVVSTSNASIADKLKSIKYNPEGEMARMIELYVPKPTGVDYSEIESVFSQLPNNYGHAGAKYLDFVVRNLTYCRNKYREIAVQCDRVFKFEPQDRFHKAVICAAFTGAVIAKEIGLIDINIGKIQAWLEVQYPKIRLSISAKETIDPSSIVLDFINEHINNMLIINDLPVRGNLLAGPIKEPRNSLMMRYEPDTDTLYIVRSDFNTWCIRRQVNINELAEGLKARGSMLDDRRKVIGKGTAFDIGLTRTYCITAAKGVMGLGAIQTSAIPTAT